MKESVELRDAFPKEPEIVHARITDTLKGIRETKPSKVTSFPKRRMLLLIAVITVLCSATAIAASLTWKERMEALTIDEVLTIWKDTNSYNSQFTSRGYYESERERLYNTLLYSYEEEGVFPQKELTIVKEYNKENPKEPVFDLTTATLFLPKRELTDEEILQIIDYNHKINYALQKVYFEKEAGNLEYPEVESPDKPSVTTEDFVALNDSVYFKKLKYDGSLSIFKAAANSENLFICSKEIVECINQKTWEKNTIYSVNEGQIFSIACDDNNNLYLSLLDASFKSRLLRFSSSGEALIYEIEGTPVEDGIPYNMHIGPDGELYTSLRNADGVFFYVFDKNGAYIGKCSDSAHTPMADNGMCFGKDGYIYQVSGDELLKIDPKTYETVDFCSFKGNETFPSILELSERAPGEFLMICESGILSYTWKSPCAEYILRPYETDNSFGECTLSIKAADSLYAIIDSDQRNDSGLISPENAYITYFSIP